MRAEVRLEVARELYRHRIRRGGYVRAETPAEVRARERYGPIWLRMTMTMTMTITMMMLDDDDDDDDDADADA